MVNKMITIIEYKNGMDFSIDNKNTALNVGYGGTWENCYLLKVISDRINNIANSDEYNDIAMNKALISQNALLCQNELSLFFDSKDLYDETSINNDIEFIAECMIDEIISIYEIEVE
jgi:hypothetical protein